MMFLFKMIQHYKIKVLADKIEKNSRIAIYGYGSIGKDLEKHLLKFRKDIKILGVIDNKDSDKKTSQEDIYTMNYADFVDQNYNDIQVVICNDRSDVISSIKADLRDDGVNYMDETIENYLLKGKLYSYVKMFNALLCSFFIPLLMIKDTGCSIFNTMESLMKKEWKYLSGSTKRIAYNNLFYYIQDYNIQKFGRYKKSNILSGGSLDLKTLFHMTPVSLRFQAGFGTTFTLFFAMCFWTFSWILLYGYSNELLLVVTLCIFSTLFFAVFIEQQNYNILAWMLYPIFLSSLIYKNYLLLTAILFLISLFSFTSFFISMILLGAISLYTADILLLFTALPGLIKWSSPIILSLSGSNALKKIADILGMNNSAKYQRVNHKLLTINKLYIFMLMIQFCCVALYYVGLGQMTLLLLIVIVLFLLNELLVRFADQQSFYIAYLSTAVHLMLNSEYNLYMLLSYVLSLYPAYGYLMNMRTTSDSFLTPGIKKPFDMKGTIHSLCDLYKDVPEGERIFMAYKNPQRDYNNIFNGYRWFNEPMQYAATIKNISFFPDWYMVLNNNTQNGTEEFWVDNSLEIIDYVKKQSLKYVLVPHFLFEEKILDTFKLLGKYKMKYRDGHIKQELKIYLLELKC